MSAPNRQSSSGRNRVPPTLRLHHVLRIFYLVDSRIISDNERPTENERGHNKESYDSPGNPHDARHGHGHINTPHNVEETRVRNGGITNYWFSHYPV